MENYLTAAIRHLHDAELLKSSGHLENAGHLIGFAGECAIKHKISTIKKGVSPHGHFPSFKVTALKHINSRESMYHYLNGDIYDGWDVNHRYCGNGVTTAAKLDEWIKETKRLFATAGIKEHK